MGVLVVLCCHCQSVLQGGGSADSSMLSSPVQVAGLRGQGVHATVRDHSGRFQPPDTPQQLGRVWLA